MSQFKGKVIEIVQIVPHGKVASYGQIAALSGVPRAARHVGRILSHANQDLAWWRIINNAGYISIKGSNFSAEDQKVLLESEGVKVSKNYEINMSEFRWIPSLDLMRSLSLDDKEIFEITERFNFPFN